MAVSTATYGAKVHSHRVRNLKLDQKSTTKVGGRMKRCLMVYNFRSMNVRCKIEQNAYYRTRNDVSVCLLSTRTSQASATNHSTLSYILDASLDSGSPLASPHFPS